MRPKATAMTVTINQCVTWVALLLALTAAIVSMPNAPGMASRFAKLLSLGTLPEAQMLAGSIGEHPESLMGP
jgi:hypothetical protein